VFFYSNFAFLLAIKAIEQLPNVSSSKFGVWKSRLNKNDVSSSRHNIHGSGLERRRSAGLVLCVNKRYATSVLCRPERRHAWPFDNDSNQLKALY